MYCRKVKVKTGHVWECVEDGPRNTATGRRRQIKRRGKTKIEAKQRVENLIKSLEEDGIDHRMTSNMTFEKVANTWLEVYAATGVKRGSVRIREKEVNLLNYYLAQAPISEITHYMYQNLLIDLDKRDYARSTISGVNTCANMIFKYAKRNKLIKENPREDAIVPKKKISIKELEENSIEDSYFENDELDRFLNAVLTIGLNLDKEWFFTLAFSGMRPGELIALKKSDLNFKNNTIRISKTLYNENNNMKDYTLDTTKTNRSRIVDMDDHIMKMLKSLIKANDMHKMKYRTLLEDFHDENFVFQRENGYPFTVKNISSRMKRLLKFAKISKRLTPHSFRHTHISMLTEAGAELPTIMLRVGHIDPNTTLKVYTHVTEKMKVTSMENVTSHHSNILKKLSF